MAQLLLEGMGEEGVSPPSISGQQGLQVPLAGKKNGLSQFSGVGPSLSEITVKYFGCPTCLKADPSPGFLFKGGIYIPRSLHICSVCCVSTRAMTL